MNFIKIIIRKSWNFGNKNLVYVKIILGIR